MTDGEDGRVQRMQPLRRDASTDCGARQARVEQLSGRHDAELPCGERGDPRVWAGIGSHTDP
jgi:hypothetical protein